MTLNPTEERLRLADAIAARHIRHYHFITPSSLDTVRNREVTDRVKKFVDAGLAEYGTPDGEDQVRNWSTVVLTPDGMAWVTRARTAGPGFTSPEPGPDVPTITESEVIGWIADERQAWAESTKDGTE